MEQRQTFRCIHSTIEFVTFVVFAAATTTTTAVDESARKESNAEAESNFGCAAEEDAYEESDAGATISSTNSTSHATCRQAQTRR